MLQPIPKPPFFDIEAIITEDDTPVDNLLSEKQQRLLTEPLYSSWSGPGEGRPFLAAANVGVFADTHEPAIVPDMFISLDVRVPEDWMSKLNRSHFVQVYRKPPDLVLEIVSNKKGNEDDEKWRKYAGMGIPYYVIFDPLLHILPRVLTIYRLWGKRYVLMEQPWFPELRLGLTLWHGEFEGKTDDWLRWTDANDQVIPTGKEAAEQADQRAEQERWRAQQERQRAEQADQRAEQERRQAEQAKQHAEEAMRRAEHLAALLREAGIEP